MVVSANDEVVDTLCDQRALSADACIGESSQSRKHAAGGRLSRPTVFFPRQLLPGMRKKVVLHRRRSPEAIITPRVLLPRARSPLFLSPCDRRQRGERGDPIDPFGKVRIEIAE